MLHYPIDLVPKSYLSQYITFRENGVCCAYNLTYENWAKQFQINASLHLMANHLISRRYQNSQNVQKLKVGP